MWAGLGGDTTAQCVVKAPRPEGGHLIGVWVVGLARDARPAHGGFACVR